MILFYFATSEELTPWRPVGKFVCVKSVVFFTWWQSIVITLLYYAGWIRANNKMVNSIVEEDTKVSEIEIDGTTYKITEFWSAEEIAKGVQNYLICVEMLLAAIAHHYSFTYKDYKHVNTRPIVTSSGEMLTPPVYGAPTEKRRESSKGRIYGKESSSQNMDNNIGGNGFRNEISEEDEENMPFLSAFIESTIPKDFIRDLDIIRKGAFSMAKKGVGIANATYQNYNGNAKILANDGSNLSSGMGKSAYGSTNLDVEMSDVNIVEIDI